MKKAFDLSLRLNKDNKIKLSIINEIIEEYRQMGYTLTLRQLYYQLVTRKVIANQIAEYQKLSILLGKGRMGGIVDWNAIEDRVRAPRSPYTVEDPKDALQDAIDTYRIDRSKYQTEYIEVWVEKDALSGVLYPVTSKYSIPLMVNRGYSSITAMYKAYLRLHRKLQYGKNITIIYLGDHDPSGLDMIRDIKTRLLMFLGCLEDINQKEGENFIASERGQELIDELSHLDDYQISKGRKRYTHIGKLMYYDRLNIVPVALTMNQIEEQDLPPDPAKITDPRAKDYIRQFGKESWELDALNPRYLNNLLETSITDLINVDAFNLALKTEEKDIEELKSLVDSLNR